MNENKKILVFGATGFLGKNLKEYLEDSDNFDNDLLTFHNGIEELDLLNEEKVNKYIKSKKPDIIFNCSAFVGGIGYGYKYPGKLLHDNSKMVLNIFQCAVSNSVNKLINPISNCAYPGELNFYEEKNFWNGKPHESVFNYALTRRLIVALGESYFSQYKLNTSSLILSNMYGKYDHFDEMRSHALGALIKKIHDAKENNKKSVIIWGTGDPIREWLHVDDGVQSMVRASKLADGNYFFNVGVNKGLTIKELAIKIAKLLEWEGEFEFDLTKPDGAKEKRVDGTSSKTYLDWEPEVNLDEGLAKTINWYVEQK